MKNEQKRYISYEIDEERHIHLNIPKQHEAKTRKLLKQESSFHSFLSCLCFATALAYVALTTDLLLGAPILQLRVMAFGARAYVAVFLWGWFRLFAIVYCVYLAIKYLRIASALDSVIEDYDAKCKKRAARISEDLYQYLRSQKP